MEYDYTETPLYTKLVTFKNNKPISFHVPGHKHGSLFPPYAKDVYADVLSIDATELTGLDDLHAPDGVIHQAELLAADYFKSDYTFFLVGGSTAGNLAMILSSCSLGDKLIVQRNCHKSVMNGLELSGARPIFVAPEYDETVDRYTAPKIESIKQAIDSHPDAKGLVLTYPDYFGKTFDMKTIIDYAHQHGIPVLVDEAHGVHFSLGAPFPPSSLELGADLVVQSAHKMAPSMTMSSYLHMRTNAVSTHRVRHFLQIIQSSSPSYPLMASLDIARSFLARLKREGVEGILESVRQVRSILTAGNLWSVLPETEKDDPLKITLQVQAGMSGFTVAKAFEKNRIYPELATHNQVLFVHGLAAFQEKDQLNVSVKRISEQLKMMDKHATIDIGKLFPRPIDELSMDYQQMNKRKAIRVSVEKAIGEVAADSIIPYPPGVPILIKGERITVDHIVLLTELMEQGANIQTDDIAKGIYIYKGDNPL
ncbi:lysine decarboxylase [Virgibacillus phasianinus]|uniref:Lysine decarboxylase n=1 Tax=Virgibacillus phasianinus TaxID=2017483 RepID=A0A220U1R3_9BACI|nr:aminotransferase class I/II-fold pyridoxal phosphate-dependent enzyme [Virgibacillus phasianinus]ASK61733.1 lysine decarboxylase [Virgibacillus phasianinus]